MMMMMMMMMILYHWLITLNCDGSKTVDSKYQNQDSEIQDQIQDSGPQNLDI